MMVHRCALTYLMMHNCVLYQWEFWLARLGTTQWAPWETYTGEVIYLQVQISQLPEVKSMKLRSSVKF